MCVSGAAELPRDVVEEFERLTGGRLVEGYGLTEASPLVAANPLWEGGVRKPGSIGIPLPDTDARIVDMETGTRTLAAGEPGELVVRGPQVMQGYWNAPADTANAIRDGWLYTGDIARTDEDGYFFLVDRKKDMIITGGLNVYPREIEEVLRQHPGVRQAGVVGVKHPIRGETIVAYVVPGAPRGGPERAPCRHPRVPPGTAAKLQGAEAHRARGRDPDDAHREAAAPGAPRPGRPRRRGRPRRTNRRHQRLTAPPPRSKCRSSPTLPVWLVYTCSAPRHT